MSHRSLGCEFQTVDPLLAVAMFYQFLPLHIVLGCFMHGKCYLNKLMLVSRRRVIFCIAGLSVKGSSQEAIYEVEGIDVSDAPRYEHRGVMIDVARNFQPMTAILKLIDLLAMYKLNKLHLHLADDEGWRLQIPGLDELTEVRHSGLVLSCLHTIFPVTSYIFSWQMMRVGHYRYLASTN